MAVSLKEQIRVIVEPIANEMGLYLVDVEITKMGKSRLVRIYADCDGGIDMNRCETFHRAIVDPLEDVDYDYLEVSSPGDRPLKSEQDFKRMQGREVEVRLYAARDGKKLFGGVLLGRDADVIRITEEESGAEMEFAAKDVSSVKPMFRLDF
ncbi:MAG: ribosome maturation factor RimP [Clostridia bacterium]|nr:ribosome maturation factor RimP [Clostridia bacterium]MBR3196819.1 ribosome maturation factor RimP [Clostridia bacterium]